MRALAVTMVVLFHLGFSWIPGGFVGVDVFFVMSGYLITGLLLTEIADHGRIRFGRFYARRIRRLLPAAAVVLLAVIWASLHLDLLERQSVGHDVTAAALYLANWRFTIEDVGYFTPGDVPSPLVHFWSLAVEEQFYLVWPAIFALLWRLGRNRSRRTETTIFFVGAGILGAASLAASVVLVPSASAYYGTHTRAYQLLAGALLAFVADRLAPRVDVAETVRGVRARWMGRGAVGASLGVLIWLGHGIVDATTYPGWNGVAITLASVVLVAALDFAPLPGARRVFGWGPVAALGRLSYSLYLWHWPIIVFAPVFATEWDLDWLDDTPVMVAAMAVCALASYQLVEHPVRFRLRPAIRPRWVIAAGLVVSGSVAAAEFPVLQPQSAYQTEMLAVASDVAHSAPCPYTLEAWGPTEKAEPCVVRRGGDFTVALVGDSHAQQWAPAIDAIAERYDLTVIRLTRQGCPANDITVYSMNDNGRAYVGRSCTEWRRKLYADLVADFDPDLIYVETRSHDWGIHTDTENVLASDPRHTRLWAQAWIPTFDRLTAGTGQVVVGRTTPNITWRVPACLASHAPGTDDCDMPLADDVDVARVNAAFDEVAATRDDITVVDATPIICPDEMCPAVIDGTVVHRDDDHISATFAARSADAFEQLLVDAGVHLPPR